MTRKYDPSNRYNESGGSGRTSYVPAYQAASTSSPLLPRQVLGSPTAWRIAAVLDGATDERFRYKPTSTDLSTPFNFTFKFPHSLSIIPNVTGTWYYGESVDGLSPNTGRRSLPYDHFNDTELYYDGVGIQTPDYHIAIDQTDQTYIYVRVVIMNDLGLSLFIANQNRSLFFKFYCFEDATV